MAVHGRSQPPVNGGAELYQPDAAEVREYEKILSIHDQIFSGTHPRLKVPPHVVRKVTPRSVQASPVSGSHGVPEPSSIPKSRPQWATQSGASWKNGNGSSINNSPSADSAPVPNHTPTSRVSTKTTSEIDPIFLTKSDDLVRAEMQLQRQRVERTLRDQVEQKRTEARQQALTQDAKPDFDVSNVLEKALEIAKPVEPSDVQPANRNAAASDSFDENSFYSSRAPDSPQHSDQRPVSPLADQQAQPMEIDELDADAPVDHRLQNTQAEPSNAHIADQEADIPPFTVGSRQQRSPKQPDNASMRGPQHNYLPQDDTDAYEEPEYSPPGPDIPASRKASLDYGRRGMDTRRRGSGRMSGRGQHGRRSMSPRDMRVVRNHITSPAAPQPSRVSPLAVAKMASIPQVRQERRAETGQESTRASPEGPIQPIMSRKRRRMQDSGDNFRHVAPRQAAESPRPYIKEEPVSPPPFSDVPAVAPRHRQVPEKPVYVDSTSPRYTPVPERREYSQRGPVYESDRYVKRYDIESPVEPNVIRAPSQIGYRRPMRDTQDLRRVASLQHARQPETPQDYAEPIQPSSARATSYAVVERPSQPERTSRYYEEPVQTYPRRYVEPEEDSAVLAPRLRDNYDEMEIDPRPMGPPQRRIVVDERGNQYYESALPKAQHQPPIRRAGVEPYSERPQVRSGSMRAASIIEDSYGERRYVQEMPPPPPTYRRVTDYARSVAPERRPYMREYEEKEPIMRSESVQMMDYPPRHRTAYVEDHGLPREDVVRVASVRPQHRQYEEPREMVQRVQSVRPGGREVSVYVDDEQRQPREYIPMDRQGYGMARPAREERYYADDDGDRMIIDGREVHRLPPRY